MRHRRWIGETGGLDNDGVEFSFLPHQAVQNAHEIAAHGAADAAVVHLEDFLIGADHEIVVDADFAKFINDHRVFLAVGFGEYAVEQGRLAGPEIAGQHRHRDLFGQRLLGHSYLLALGAWARAACCWGANALAAGPLLALVQRSEQN